jgi:hypothetical protein
MTKIALCLPLCLNSNLAFKQIMAKQRGFKHSFFLLHFRMQNEATQEKTDKMGHGGGGGGWHE